MSKLVSICMIDDNGQGTKFENFLKDLCQYFDLIPDYNEFGDVIFNSSIEKLKKYCHFEIINPSNLKDALNWIDQQTSFSDIMIVDMIWPPDDINGGVEIIRKLKAHNNCNTIICSNTTDIISKYKTLVNLGVDFKINPLNEIEHLRDDLPRYLKRVATKYYLGASDTEINAIKSLLNEIDKKGRLFSDEQLLENSVIICNQEWKIKHFLLSSWHLQEKKYYKVRSALEEIVRGIKGPIAGPWKKGLLSAYYRLKDNKPDEFNELWKKVFLRVEGFINGDFDNVEESEKLDCVFFATGKNNFDDLRAEKLIDLLEKILSHRLIVLFEAAISKNNKILFFDIDNKDNNFRYKRGFPSEFQQREMDKYLNTFLGFGRKGYNKISMPNGVLTEEYVILKFENLLPEELEWLELVKPELKIQVKEKFPYLYLIIETLSDHINNNKEKFSLLQSYRLNIKNITLSQCENNFSCLLKETNNKCVIELFKKLASRIISYPSIEESQMPNTFPELFKQILLQEVDRSED